MTCVTSSKLSMKLREVKILVGGVNRFEKNIGQISSSPPDNCQIKTKIFETTSYLDLPKGAKWFLQGCQLTIPLREKNWHPFFQVLVEIAQDLTKCPGPKELQKTFTFQLQVTFHAWRGVPGR